MGEKKKGKYVYYHCTDNKGKCPEPYAREEVLEACFAAYKGLVFDDEVMDWIFDACIRATQTRSDSDRLRLLACKKNEAKSRTVLIGSTMIRLMDLSNRFLLIKGAGVATDSEVFSGSDRRV